MKVIVKLIVVFWAVMLTYGIGRAQYDCIFEHISTDNGLSHGSVSAMLKDKQGFMWFATWDGINRYDGNSFKIFKPSNTVNDVLASNRIEQMKEDSLGNIWVMTYDSKLFRLNHYIEVFDQVINEAAFPATHITDFFPATTGDVWVLTNNNGVFCVKTDTSDYSFEVLHFNIETEPALPANQISFVAEDLNHNIWINTIKGIVELEYNNEHTTYSMRNFSDEIQSIFNGNQLKCFYETPAQIFFGTNDGSLLSYQKKNEVVKLIETSVNTTISNISSSECDHIYLGTKGKGIFEFDLQTESISKHFDDPFISNVLKMYPDSKGNIWVESTKSGISKIDTKTKSLKHFEQDLNVNPIIRSNAQCGLMEDESQTLWLTLKGGGFGYYNPVSDEVEYFYNEPGNPESRLSNFVNCFYKDPSGVLWMSTYFKGIEKVTFVDQKFQLIQPAPQANLGLDNEVRALMQDSFGLLWVATKNQEVFLLDEQYKVVHKIEALNGGNIGSVYTMLEDSKGAIYLGTKGKGLFVLQRKGLFEFNVEHYINNSSDSMSISNNNIYSIIEDHKGRIWMGTYGGGVNLKNGERFIHSGNVLKSYPRNEGTKVRHLAEDRKGNIWMGTTNGLIFLNVRDGDPSEMDFSLYNQDLKNVTGLPGNDIFWIFCDQQNNIWLATLGGGLARLQNYPEGNTSLVFSHFSSGDGLPSDVIFTITNDETGHLWMSTENGISNFDPERFVFKNYNRYDGLLSSGFSEAAMAHRNDGSICFGANNGIYWFQPKDVETPPKQIALEFSGLKVFGKEIVPGKNEELKRSITETVRIQLQHNQNVLDISWAALDYKMQDKILFDFKLEGFDANWHTFSDQTHVNYNMIPPGKYTFQVRFSNPELQAMNATKTLSIEILPPYWQTTWAYLIYLLLFIFLIEVTRRTITSMIRLRNKVIVEKELSNIKLNFFTNISHELRTPLTLILGPAKELTAKEALSDKGKVYVQLIENNAQRLLRLVNQLLDFRKIESRKMELELKEVNLFGLVKKVVRQFDELAIEKNIRFLHNFPNDQHMVSIDEEKMDTVLFNLLSNAFKFTPDNGSIEVEIRYSVIDKSVDIEVVDHGIGISPEQESTLFEMFSSHSTTQQRGSGIGLAFSKELVQLHHGELTYAPTPGGGATFIVRLKSELSVQPFIPSLKPSIAADADSVKQKRQFKKATEHSSSMSKLLIVEDQQDLRNFLRMQLENSYRIEEAAHGKEGWEKALQWKPDIVLSDVMMPVMDGIQLLEKMKNSFETSHIPVVLLTAKSSVESKIEGLKYGADAYLTKPFSSEQLLVQLENLLQQRFVLRQRYMKLNTQSDIFEEISITDRDALFLKQISEIIEKQLSNTEFKTSDIYQQLGMGRSKFYDKMKGLTGLSPIEYVMELRLNKAYELLQAGVHNVSETSYLSGFTDAGYFSKCFKERYGINPSHVVKNVP